MVKLPKGVCHLELGLFGLIRHNRMWGNLKPAFIEWYRCRDSFQYAWRRHCKHAWLDRSFFFCCTQEHVQDFLKCAEKELGLWKRTKIDSTNVPGVCSIQPAPFWSKREIRMSLLTILLRAGEHYKPNSNWRECLYAHPYARETKEAIEYFFSGHTVYSLSQPMGWCQVFMSKQKELLHRPASEAVGCWLKSWFN